MRHAMIMAGGAGTRLWPLSRKDLPKQLVPLYAGRSLLEIAAQRLEGLIPADRRWICTGESYRPVIRERLPEFADDRILGEPVGRDTVNAVAFAAAVIEKVDPGAGFAVFTADHLIEPVETFQSRVDLAFRLIEDDRAGARRLATFSIAPTHPATGYGYIERGAPIEIEGGRDVAFGVERFKEKPDLATAQQYLASGRFSWNSGMFVWRASTFLEALKAFCPEAHEGALRIADAWGGPDQQRVLEQVYPTLPRISVDFAVMEPASRDERFEICTVVADVSWRDVGSWPSLAETLDADASGNRVAGEGETTLLDCADSLVFNAQKGHRVAVLGAQGLVVVHTPDATLVMPAADAERLKELHARLPEELR